MDGSRTRVTSGRRKTVRQVPPISSIAQKTAPPGQAHANVPHVSHASRGVGSRFRAQLTPRVSNDQHDMLARRWGRSVVGIFLKSLRNAKSEHWRTPPGFL